MDRNGVEFRVQKRLLLAYLKENAVTAEWKHHEVRDLCHAVGDYYHTCDEQKAIDAQIQALQSLKVKDINVERA